MKGVILAGGKGGRLKLCTRVTNKHLLAVYDRPMIFYPLLTLKHAGIKEILIVTGKEHMGDMLELLGSGSEFGMDFSYKVQDKASGIAKALYLAKDFVRGEGHFLTMLGDNILEERIHPMSLLPGEAKIFLREVPDPERFGVAVIRSTPSREAPSGTEHFVDRIVEKPKKQISDLAVIGIYIYDSSVFPIIEKLKPSPPPRSEYEITAVNNAYIKRGKLKYSIVKGFWSDMGTPGSLLRSAMFVKEKLSRKLTASEIQEKICGLK